MNGLLIVYKAYIIYKPLLKLLVTTYKNLERKETFKTNLYLFYFFFWIINFLI